MDSRLLSVFHDDPFDGNYMKLQNDTDYWSNDNETMDLQLTDTLQGILPITNFNDHEDVQSMSSINNVITDCTYANKYVNNNFLIENKLERSTVTTMQNTDMFYCNDFSPAEGGGETIEIVSVNRDACDYDSDTDGNGNDFEYIGLDVDTDAEDGGAELEAYASCDDYDGQSEYSTYTFRSRTDSSSIADYESHTSDYDDDDGLDDNLRIIDENIDIFRQDDFGNFIDFNTTQLHSNNTASGIETSTNKVSEPSEIDSLCLQIDTGNFDLTEFITKDDFIENVSTPIQSSKKTTAKETRQRAQCPTVVLHVEHSDSDSDLDVIVDVETIETEDKPKLLINNAEQPEDDAYVDNIKCDPYWSPIQAKKHEKDTSKSKPKPKSQATNIKTSSTVTTSATITNVSFVPNKKQCDILKSLSSSSKVVTKKSTTKRSGKRHSVNSKAISIPKVGLGQGGKNLKLLDFNPRNNLLPKKSHNNASLSTSTGEAKSKKLSVDIVLATPTVAAPNAVAAIAAPLPAADITAAPIAAAVLAKPLAAPLPAAAISAAPIAAAAITAAPITTSASNTSAPLTAAASVATTFKRKLNLEEYKKRRGENLVPRSNDSISNAKVPKLKTDAAVNNAAGGQRSALQVQTVSNITSIKHSAVVTAVVRNLKAETTQQKQATDPITEAKNKVLRLQELKKAQQIKIIDSTVSAKVARVTKLLPLKDIVKDTYYAVADQQEQVVVPALRTNPDYEEIIIVSASCNTDISIPPISSLPPSNKSAIAMKIFNRASRSLLKSSVLLYNATNTYGKVQAIENGKIPTSSLIASIQDVVRSKIPEVCDADNMGHLKASNAVVQHGEDKVIMHLRKDRIRKPAATIATQTDFLPVFAMEKTSAIRKSREREKKSLERNYRKASTSSSSLDSDSASVNSHSPAARSYGSCNRSVVMNSCCSMTESGPQYKCDTNGVGTTAASGGYSSRSTCRHRSSISSSYSETERNLPTTSANTLNRRQRRTSNKQLSKKNHPRARSPSSSSSSDYSDCIRSRSRSQSPYYHCTRRSPSTSRSRLKTSGYNNNNNNNSNNRVSQPAVEERRIVYVGRIEHETTKEMLRRKFLPYGTIKQITIHYKENDMKYGFITYERAQDAFSVIDTGAKDPQINMYDLSFGGRRAFCRSSYADLDNAGINTYQSYVFPQVPEPPKADDSFEALLQKVKAKMIANKSTPANNTNKI